MAGTPETLVFPARQFDERLSSPGLLLALLGREARQRLADAHRAHGLNLRQVQLLGHLYDHGPTAQRELGHALGVDPSILVALLNPLEAQDLLARERAPQDRRRHTVRLTPAGARHLAQAAQAQRDAERELFASLPEPQRQQLHAALLSLRDSLSSLAPPDAF